MVNEHLSNDPQYCNCFILFRFSTLWYFISNVYLIKNSNFTTVMRIMCFVYANDDYAYDDDVDAADDADDDADFDDRGGA